MSRLDVSPVPAVQPNNNAYRQRLTAVAFWFVCASLIFAPTLQSMVRIWVTSETFTHGFVILPIAVWLSWRCRARWLPLLDLGPSPYFLIFMPLFVFAWLLARLVDVQLVMQLAFVAILVSGVVSILGVAVSRVLVFPLGFLFLSVPMGIGLEPPMMDLTAHYTVKLVQLTGIPVYQEGRFFQLPSGSWSVVEACSGVRYLIASFTLGLIYAHLTYRSVFRKGLFLLAAVFVPIVANVLRAYMIVMLGHLSDMRIATGVDHLIYGWVFFGVVMVILFWLGGLWADNPEQAMSRDIQPPITEISDSNNINHGSGSVWRVACLALLIGASGPIFSMLLVQNGSDRSLPRFAFEGAGDWECTTGASLSWSPSERNADRRVTALCDGVGRIEIVADQYVAQRQGKEVADYFSDLKGDTESAWRALSTEHTVQVLSSGENFPLELALLHGPSGKQIIVAAWYVINSSGTVSPLEVKLREALLKLIGSHRVSSRVLIAVPAYSTRDEAESLIAGFLDVNGMSLNEAMDVGERGR